MQLIKIRPGDDCTSCQEVFIAEIRLKLKNIGKTTRPFRFDLNQIPYNHVVIDVTNRFKGLDLIEFQNYGWRFITYRRQ